MSVSPLFEAYDAPMFDFSDDVLMQAVAPLDGLPEAFMATHDVQHPSYGEDGSVEVDMEEYQEYEMEDETAAKVDTNANEPFDIEVLDISHLPSPQPAVELLQPSDILSEPDFQAPQTYADSPIPTSDTREDDITVIHGELPTSDAPHSDSPPRPEFLSAGGKTEDVESLDFRLPRGPSPAPVASIDSTSHLDTLATAEDEREPEGHPHPDATPQADLLPAHDESHPRDGSPIIAPALPEETPVTPSHIQGLTKEHMNQSSVAAVLHPTDTTLITTAGELALADGADYHATTEDLRLVVGEDSLEASQGVYAKPPPTVLLSIGTSTETSYFLFSQPSSTSHDVGDGATTSHHTLLEDTPTLYYEPLSTVFDAFRQDEDLLALILHSFEGELVLDAYDLQLVVSEDNVHCRDISLYDLNTLHDGSDFAGPLRLRLTAIHPRFIFRYYALQEQIHQLNLSVGVTPDNDDDQERFTGDQQEHSEGPDIGDQAPVSELHDADRSNNESTASHEASAILQESLSLPQESREPPATQPPEGAEDGDYYSPTGEAFEEVDNYPDGSDADGSMATPLAGAQDGYQARRSASPECDTAPPAGESTEPHEYYLHEHPLTLELDEQYGDDFEDRASGDPFLDDATQDDAGVATEPDLETEDTRGEHDVSSINGEGRVTTATLRSDALAAVSPRLYPVSEGPPGELSDSEALQALPSRPPSPAALSHNSDRTFDEEVHTEIEDVHNEEIDDGVQRANAPRSGSQAIAIPIHDDGLSVEPTEDVEDKWSTEWNYDWVWDGGGVDDGGEDQGEPDSVSNESSVTLSSKASCKRGHEEVDEDAAPEISSTPDSKRARVG